MIAPAAKPLMTDRQGVVSSWHQFIKYRYAIFIERSAANKYCTRCTCYFKKFDGNLLWYCENCVPGMSPFLFLISVAFDFLISCPPVYSRLLWILLTVGSASHSRLFLRYVPCMFLTIRLQPFFAGQLSRKISSAQARRFRQWSSRFLPPFCTFAIAPPRHTTSGINTTQSYLIPGIQHRTPGATGCVVQTTTCIKLFIVPATGESTPPV